MSTVAIVKCSNVHEAETAVRNSLALLGWDRVKTVIRAGRTVLIKPNVCTAK